MKGFMCVKSVKKFGREMYYSDCPFSRFLTSLKKSPSLTSREIKIALKLFRLKLAYSGKQTAFLKKEEAQKIREKTQEEEIEIWVPKELEV